MSRSRRRNPYITDLQYSRNAARRKRAANRSVRKAKDVGNGGDFKKYYESWRINDFSFYCPEERKARNK